MLLIILLFIIIFVVFIAFSEKMKQFREQNRDFYNFFLTLSATFMGVVLAIYLTGISAERQEKKEVIQLLEIAQSNASLTSDTIEMVENVLVKYNSKGQSEKYGLILIDQLFEPNNGIPYPILFEKVVDDDRLLKHLSARGVNVFYDAQRNLEKQELAIKNPSSNFSQKIASMADYRKQVKYINQMLGIEIKYLKGGLSERELDALYTSNGIDLIGITKEEYEEIIKEYYK